MIPNLNNLSPYDTLGVQERVDRFCKRSIKKSSKVEGLKRKERKKRILRSWRIQTTFCIVCIMIPIMSLMMMELGWKNVDAAWEEVQSIVDDVEALAFRGWNILNMLETRMQPKFH